MKFPEGFPGVYCLKRFNVWPEKHLLSPCHEGNVVRWIDAEREILNRDLLIMKLKEEIEELKQQIKLEEHHDD